MQSLLTVTSPASSYDLTVLETVKLELGIKESDTSKNALLTAMIHQISSAMSTICNRVFAEETVSEVFRYRGFRSWDGRIGGRNYGSLILRRRPISSIVSITENDIVIDPSEYECDFGSGIVYRLMNNTNEFRTTSWGGDRTIVSYVSGWLLLDDLPYDIERACIEWVTSLYTQSRPGGGSGGSLLRVEDVPGLLRKEYFSSSQVIQSQGVKGYFPPPKVMQFLQSYIITAIR